jgi:hypothetical protein
MPAGAASPEELEGMLEDACLLNDTLVLPSLFDLDAVLLARGTNQVRGRPAIANVIIDQLRNGGSCLDHLSQCNLGGQAKPGRLALRDQSARPMTCSQPDWRSCPSKRVTISLTFLSLSSIGFPRMLLAFMGGP